MPSKFNTLILVWVMFVTGDNKLFAAFPVSANAGANKIICINDTVTIGGNPTGHDGVPPYKYKWYPALGLSSDTVANPLAQPGSTIWYHLTVKDSLGDSCLSAVMITVGSGPLLNATADSNSICQGAQLHGSIQSSCGLGPAVFQSSVAQIGTGTLTQPGSYISPPYIFGNLQHSSRQQMLYTAAELQAALGGPQAIKGFAFDIAVFNSNAFIQNLTFSMGCTDVDSLANWQDGLQELLSIPNFQSGGGWQNFSFNNTFYWDGVSNIVVDLCYYDPITYGNAGNKAQCSNTAHSSYLFVQSMSQDLCGIDLPATPSTLRPNIKLSYGTPLLNTYTYLWSPATGPNAVSNAFIANPKAAPNQTTTYFVTATDGLGCRAIDSVVVVANVTHLLKDSFVTQATQCYGDTNGSACVIISGGAPPYTHRWSDGDTSLCKSHLAQGFYNISISDQNGCTLNDSAIVASPGQLYTSAVVKNVSCYGANDGQITLTAYGGTIPYSYQWSSGNTYPLSGGSYFVTVTDAHGCHVAALYVVREPALLNLNLTATPVSCFGANNGAITPLVTGGTQPYHYLWSDASRTPIQTGLTAGLYSLQLTDSNGCYAFDSIVVHQPAQIIFDITASTDSLLSGLTDTLTATVISGGILPYQYYWTDSLTGPVIYVNQCGTYTVTIADSVGCNATGNYVLSICYSDSTIGIPVIAPTNLNVQIFPNPANYQLNITTGLSQTWEISLADLTGQQVIHQSPQTGNYTIDISSLSSGVYLINLKANGEEYHGKFTKVDSK